MSLTTKQIDTFIDTAINRLSGARGLSTSHFHIDLREYQSRITKKLVDDCISKCEARGLSVERVGDGLSVTVDLDTCVLNSSQSETYNVALNYTRSIHGNHL